MSTNKSRIVFLCFFTIFTLFSGICAFAAEVCTVKNIVQYMPDGLCQTKSRTCCDNGYFSEWNQACPVVDKKKECENSGGCWNGTTCKMGYAFDYPMYDVIFKKEYGESCHDAILRKLQSDNWANIPADAQECPSVLPSCNLCGKTWYCYGKPVILSDNSADCRVDSRYAGCTVY